MNITTTVSWDTLISSLDDELEQYQEGYDELERLAREEFDAALDEPTTNDDLLAIQQQAARFDAGAQEVQKRQHALESLREEYGGGDFEIKMLSGSETIEIETQLRAEANERGIDVGELQNRRREYMADAATVDAPVGVERDESDSPVPSDEPAALMLALADHIEQLTSSGAVDFRPVGCGSADGSPPASLQTPSTSNASPTPSAPTDDE